MNGEDVKQLFETRSFVVEAVLLRIAALIGKVRGVDDISIFFELAADRVGVEIGALKDGATVARFISNNCVTLRRLTKKVWEAWSVPSLAKQCNWFSGAPLSSFSAQKNAIFSIMCGVLMECEGEEFERIRKVDAEINKMINDLKNGDSKFTLAVRRKVAHVRSLIEDFFGYKIVSALVSDAGDGDWTDVLLERLNNESNFMKNHVVNDDDHVEDGYLQWRDVLKRPCEFVFGKFRVKYYEKENKKYFELLNGEGQLYLFLINFILFHTGISLVFDDLSVQRVNKDCRDVVFVIKKDSTKDPYQENVFRLEFLEKYVDLDSLMSDIATETDARVIETALYRFFPNIGALRGTKEICYAFESLCQIHKTRYEPYVLLAMAYQNAGWDPVASLLVYHAYNNSFVKGGFQKCAVYERNFQQVLKNVPRPEYLRRSQGDMYDQFVGYLTNVNKAQLRVRRLSDSDWETLSSKIANVLSTRLTSTYSPRDTRW